MKITRINKEGIETTATLGAFLVLAKVFPIANISNADGINIRFTGKDGADDWAFSLDRREFTAWLRVTGANIYKYVSPQNTRGMGIAWPCAKIDEWNKRAGSWEYSLPHESELTDITF